MVKVIYTARYQATLKNLLENESITLLVIDKSVEWFCNNPDDTRIYNHALKKNLLGLWSFSITNDIRIVYRWLGKNSVQFLRIGGHDQVYKKSS